MLKSVRRKFRKAMFHIELGRFDKSEITAPPTHIQLEPTVRCNLHCITCSRDTVISTYKKMDLTLDEIDRILSFFPRLKSVKLQGLGEPLFHPQIEEVLKRFKDRGVRIWMISNGTLYHNEKYRNMILNYVDDLAVSFDSINKETFNMLRPYADMDRVKENIKLLVADRNKMNSDLAIGINFVISYKNYFELPGLYDLALELGIDYVSVVDVENWMIRNELGYDGASAFVAESRKFRKEIDEGVRKLRLRLLKKRIILGYKSYKKRLGSCYWPFKSVFITVEGLATPCCMRMHRTHALGNVLETPFPDIWNGERYTELRKAHISGDTSNLLCGTCPD